MSEILTTLPLALAFILGGLVWSTGGYFADWRKNKASPEYKGFQIAKLKDDVILGAILGIVAFFLNAYQGDVITIVDVASFGGAIVTAFGVVGIVDKYVVNGIFNK